MPISVGNNKIFPAGIKKVYVGNNLVYSKEPSWHTIWTGLKTLEKDVEWAPGIRNIDGTCKLRIYYDHVVGQTELTTRDRIIQSVNPTATLKQVHNTNISLWNFDVTHSVLNLSTDNNILFFNDNMENTGTMWKWDVTLKQNRSIVLTHRAPSEGYVPTIAIKKIEQFY